MNAETTFLVFFWLVMGNLLVGVPLLLLISVCLPERVKSEYYRQPFYSERELRWLTQFPLSVFNNAALASMFVWSRLGKKRGVVAMGDELPGWYRGLLHGYFWVTTITLVIAISAGTWLLLN